MTMICKVDKLKNVDGSVAELRFALSPAAVAAVSDLNVAGDLVFEGRSEHRDRIIHITGEVTLTLAKQCDRCGVAVKEPLTTAFLLAIVIALVLLALCVTDGEEGEGEEVPGAEALQTE